MISYGPGWDEGRVRRTVEAIAESSPALCDAIQSGGLEVTLTAAYQEDGEVHPVRIATFKMSGRARLHWLEPSAETHRLLRALAASCGMAGPPEAVTDPASRFRSSSPPTGQKLAMLLREPDSATMRAALALARLSRAPERERLLAALMDEARLP